jgi:nucleotide-binding universal stress UspA family protein
MTIRKILVPVSGHYAVSDPQSLDASALAAGFALSRRFTAEVDVLYVSEPPSTEGTIWADWLPDYGMDALFAAIERQAGVRYQHAEASYNVALEMVGKPQRKRAKFIERIGNVSDTVGAYGRLADLIVIANSEAYWREASRPVLDAALRRTARPIFVVPPGQTDAPCRHIAIAWNDTAASARGVMGALPFLKGADQVEILCCEAADAYALQDSSAALSAYLRLHGIDADVHHLVGSAWRAHDAILSKALDLKCDLLCLGGVTHTRAHNLIYGSLTEAVLKEPRIPTLIVP